MADVKITLRPYQPNPSRWHVDIQLMHPCEPSMKIRKRLVAPAYLNEVQARTWGERKVPEILRAVLGGNDGEVPSPRKETNEKSPASLMTMAQFYAQRFEPEHVRLQKPATRVCYDSIYRNHIGPLLGDLPLLAVDEDRLMSFRAELHRRLKPTTANMVLAKVAVMLRFAKRVRALAVVPEIEKLPTPRRRRKEVLSDMKIDLLLAAARSFGSAAPIIILLALEIGLRVSEICSLEWDDLDFKTGTITVQNNCYRGEKQTPKGAIGTLTMTARLKQLLVAYRDEQADKTLGPLVFYRHSQHTGFKWAPHTPHSIRYLLNMTQRQAQLPATGPHLLRHSGLTRLAELGASIYEVQAVARHSRLETTQAYLHSQQVTLARKAAELLDRVENSSVGKSVAKKAKRRIK